MRAKRATAVLGAIVAIVGITSLGGVAAARAPRAAKFSGTLTVGELMPMSGSEAFVGEWFTHGAAAGIRAVNNAGGVMGMRLKTVLEDTAGDPVDAVPAYHALLTSNPDFVVGPSSLEILGVIKFFGASKLPDFMEGGTTALDHMHYPYVFRMFPSDSSLLAAEAYYAIHVLGCRRASLMYEDSTNAQDEVPPLVAAYTGNGGKILVNLKLEPNATSYLTEVADAFAPHPQCVFFHATPAEMSTLSGNLQEEGHLNVHFITGDTGTAVQLAKAMGLQFASKWLTGMTGAPPYAPAYKAFISAYKQVWHTSTPLPATEAMYDAVVVPALAITMAGTTNSKVWVKDITRVSNPPGTPCYTYPSCVRLLHAHKKINYQGAGGNVDFNLYHNVFTPLTVEGWTTSGALRKIYTVTTTEQALMYRH
ncbi:MAG TPA: ABC transporter substrate-binding protein [Verrucomicrobiae bacterium]|nr:ABC transporter substrate-binding protein [Verrucomicrobiae bacterium]